MSHHTIEYLGDAFQGYRVEQEPIKLRSNGFRPGQGQDGYGQKITTDMVVILDDGKKYRVYLTICSNIGSIWVKIKGKKYYLHQEE